MTRGGHPVAATGIRGLRRTRRIRPPGVEDHPPVPPRPPRPPHLAKLLAAAQAPRPWQAHRTSPRSDRQAVAPLAPPARQHPSPRLRAHAHAEAVGPVPAPPVGLIGALHPLHPASRLAGFGRRPPRAAPGGPACKNRRNPEASPVPAASKQRHYSGAPCTVSTRRRSRCVPDRDRHCLHPAPVHPRRLPARCPGARPQPMRSDCGSSQEPAIIVAPASDDDTSRRCPVGRPRGRPSEPFLFTSCG